MKKARFLGRPSYNYNLIVYSISRGRFLRFRLRASASFVRRFSPGFK